MRPGSRKKNKRQLQNPHGYTMKDVLEAYEVIVKQMHDLRSVWTMPIVPGWDPDYLRSLGFTIEDIENPR
jgi:hypothetical protein